MKRYFLEDQREVSRDQYHRLKKKASQLGCKLCEVPNGRGKHGNHKKGTDHHRYNENKISTEGYRLVIVGVGHPMDIGNGYCYEHRMVMAEKLGRWLSSNEIVHHIDRDKLNNDITNLELTTRAEHNHAHLMTDRPRNPETGRITGGRNKKAAGRILNGRTYDEMPTSQPI